VYKKYWNRIYSIALVYLKSNQLAEDAVQEVFLKLWSKRHQLTKVKNLEGFIFIIARNHLIDTLKKVMALRLRPTEPGDWLPDDLLLPAAQVELKSLQRKITDAIEMLPPQQKNVIKMSREEGLTHEQIGERLGIDKRTVKNHIVRALATLRRVLRDGKTLLLFLFL
jgi:RNA polymerase sigma-19 factor, ECF subfamily